MKRLLLLAVALLSLSGCARAQKPTNEDNRLRHDIGQMLLVGFRGMQLDDSSHIVRDIRDHNIGGVILFEYDAPSGRHHRNIASPAQLRALCTQLQSLRRSTLLIGIDQEGGRVSRLKDKQGFPSFASAEAQAASNDSVTYYARLTASTLADMGINLNFAPCVDVNTNPDCPVIGKLERSFSASPQRVTQCAAIWVDELQRQGVTACLKHFPGHGSSSKDTHVGLADVSQTWSPVELEPYRQLLASQHDIRMIMTTHVFNTQLDSVYPATLSKPTLTTLLRDSLHFQGVIITDDLAMGAMVKQYSYPEILRQAILAGADMLCLSNNGQDYNPDVVPQTIDIIYEMVMQGHIPASRIHESALRIRHLKEQLDSMGKK